MFYGIEQSTDMRGPKTVVKKFSGKPALRKWLQGGGGFTYSDPDAARNHHRSFRSGYQHIGRIDKKDKIFSSYGTRDYPRNDADNLARYLQAYGSELDAALPQEVNGG